MFVFLKKSINNMIDFSKISEIAVQRKFLVAHQLKTLPLG